MYAWLTAPPSSAAVSACGQHVLTAPIAEPAFLIDVRDRVCNCAAHAQVEALQLWARTADSDLYIAEALLGSALAPTQSLQEVLSSTIGRTPAGAPFLTRPISHEVRACMVQSNDVHGL